MKAQRWAVIADGRRVGLHGCRKAAADQVAALRTRGITAHIEPIAQPAMPSLPVIRFGAVS